MSVYQKIYQKKLSQQKQVIDLISKWEKRIASLKIRKQNPLSESQFCEKYQINKYTFNSIKNGNYPCIPSKKIIAKIENALKSEGI